MRRRTAGASQVVGGFGQQLDDYLGNHRRNLVESFRRLAARPFQSVMTVLVIAIAMALPASLYVAVANVENLGSGVEISARMSVFIKPAATEQMVSALRFELNARQDVESVEYISADQALAEFRETSGFGDSLALIEGNPLPPTLLLMPSPGLIESRVELDKLVEWVRDQDVVDEVSLDFAWLQRLQMLVATGRQVAFGLGVALALGVVLVMGNTIRMAIEARRDEIVVVKLIGGTDSYVRRPFLYSGFWYGLFSGVVAWCLVWIGFASLSDEVVLLSRLYQSEFRLEGPGGMVFCILLGCGAILGLMGAWLAVYGHLKSIEPE